MENDNKIVGCYFIKNNKENKSIHKAFILINKTSFFLSKEKNNNKFKIIIIIILISLLFIPKNIVKEIIKFRIIKNTKICICTPVKNENRYIEEYVKHYKKYGVDKIFIYDNNEVDGERLENVLGEYVKKGFVEVFNYRGKVTPLYNIMNDCYQRNYQIYDWLIFFEVDEHIHLSNYTNVKLYLQRDAFKNCEIIHLNWVQHTDNNLIHYDNRPLHIRFPEVEPNARNNVNGSINFVKSILRGHIPNVVIKNVHTLTNKLKECNGFGNSEVIHGVCTGNSDFRFYYIDHYFSKSVEEFVEKINKGDVLHGQWAKFKYFRIKNYFKRNKITLEKLNFIENHTKLNLTKYKIRLKKLSNKK